MPFKCVAFNCKGNYDSERNVKKWRDLPNLSTFAPPKEPKGMLKIWETKISRKNWKMKPTDRLCEKHFLPEDIIDKLEVEINGQKIVVENKAKRLKPGAVPVKFFHKEVIAPPKRKPPTSRVCSQTTKKRKTEVENNQEGLRETEDENKQEDSRETEESIHDQIFQPATPEIPFYQKLYKRPEDIVNLPEDWILRKKADVKLIHVDDVAVKVDKYVIIEDGNDTAKVFFNGKEVSALHCKLDSPDNANKFIQRIHTLSLCPGTGLDNVCASENCQVYFEGTIEGKVPPRCQKCFLKRKAVQRGIKRREVASRKKAAKIRSQQRTVRTQKFKIQTLEGKINSLMQKCEQLEATKVDEILCTLPPTQQEAVKACINAAKARSPKGRRYTKAWMYECILMQFKGPALYRAMQQSNTLALPSPRQIQRYLKKMKPAYGFQNCTFELLQKKSEEFGVDEKHGAILIDEMKLTEGISYDKHTMKVLGLVDMGAHTPEESKKQAGDHALVILYQPFKGRWMQTVGAFLTRGAAKGKELAKLCLDAVSRLEQCGFYVDAIVSDGASWNRTMWFEFGMLRQNCEKELDTEEEDILAGLETEEEWETTLDLASLFHIGTAKTQPPTTHKRSKSTPPQRNVRPQTSTTKKKRGKSSGPISSKPSKAKQAQEHRSKFVSCPHPIDTKRRMWFVSDFPHLIKSIKERVLHKEILKTPDGTVYLQHWKILHEQDSKRCIRLAPKLTSDHFVKNGFQTMRVGLAFSFFSEQVATAMEHYSKQGVKGLQDVAPTVAFIRRINKLIESMNANSPRKSLRPKDSQEDSDDTATPEDQPQICPECNEVHSDYGPKSKKTSRQFVEEFLDFLHNWENSRVKREFRLSSQTAFGMRVTLTAALELTDYLTSPEIGFKYFMTKRINQDALEHFFGKVRQHCGSDPHPDPLKFIQIYRLLSVGSLIRPPRGSNITGAEMLESLLNLEDIMSEETAQRKLRFEKMLDDALDSGTIVDEIDRVLGDHTYHNDERLSDYALRPFTGYVARKAKKISTPKECDECFHMLQAPPNQPLQDIDSVLHARSMGYLITPSDELYQLIKDLERAILQTLKVIPFEDNVIFTVLEHVKSKRFKEVGCPEHKRRLTKDLMTFYLNTRLIFACEDYNRHQSENAAKKRKAKNLLKLQRLTA